DDIKQENRALSAAGPQRGIVKGGLDLLALVGNDEILASVAFFKNPASLRSGHALECHVGASAAISPPARFKKRDEPARTPKYHLSGERAYPLTKPTISFTRSMIGAAIS